MFLTSMTWNLRLLALGCMGNAATWNLASWKSLYVQQSPFEINQENGKSEKKNTRNINTLSCHQNWPPKKMKNNNFSKVLSSFDRKSFTELPSRSQQPAKALSPELRRPCTWSFMEAVGIPTGNKSLIDWFFVMIFLHGCSPCLLMIIMAFTIIFANVSSCLFFWLLCRSFLIMVSSSGVGWWRKIRDLKVSWWGKLLHIEGPFFEHAFTATVCSGPILHHSKVANLWALIGLDILMEEILHRLVTWLLLGTLPGV